jgi:rRNA maturation endonuclease Nob1
MNKKDLVLKSIPFIGVGVMGIIFQYKNHTQKKNLESEINSLESIKEILKAQSDSIELINQTQSSIIKFAEIEKKYDKQTEEMLDKMKEIITQSQFLITDLYFGLGFKQEDMDSVISKGTSAMNLTVVK